MRAMCLLFEKGQRVAHMIVKLVNEGLSPVVQLHALVSPCEGASHAVVDDHKVLVPLQQGRTCTQLWTKRRHSCTSFECVVLDRLEG